MPGRLRFVTSTERHWAQADWFRVSVMKKLVGPYGVTIFVTQQLLA